MWICRGYLIDLIILNTGEVESLDIFPLFLYTRPSLLNVYPYLLLYTYKHSPTFFITP